MLFLLLRSVILPLKALVMNTLSIAASFGALVWIFQDGNLSALLGFQPLGFVETTQPVILFCVLFGLSMDYEVFLLTRMKEVWDRTGDNLEAVARGLERSGRIVTSAALIVVVVAGSFAFADIVLIKALGLGMAIAVALDATVVRALLVPATMRLLGHWNWWMPAASSGSWRPAAGVRGRSGSRGSDEPAVVALTGPSSSPSSRLPASRGACTPPGAPDPRQPAGAAPVHRAADRRRRAAVADPQPVVLPARRRAARPPDRVVVLHRPPRAPTTAVALGFEYVIFRAERGALPDDLGLAPRDHRRDRRPASTTPSDSRSAPRSTARRARATASRSAFDLALPGIDPTRPGTPATTRLGDGRAPTASDQPDGGPGGRRGRAGRVAGRPRPRPQLAATQAAGAPRQRRLDRLRAGRRLVLLLADRDGRRPARSILDGQTLPVDRHGLVRPPVGRLHRVGGGGWDWFAVNLDDGTDLTLSLVRDADGTYPLVYGTLVDPDGTTRHLDATRSPSTSPSAGRARDRRRLSGRLADRDPGAKSWSIDLAPTVAEQELDTRATTGVVYWEGSQVVRRRGAACRSVARRMSS